MSAVPVLRPHDIPSIRPQTRPRTETRPVVRPRPRVVERPQTQFGSLLFVRAVAFSVLVGVTYFASALAGGVMVEKVRREAIRSVERTHASLSALAPLKAQMREGGDAVEIGKWALANGFAAPDWATKPPTEKNHLVAKKTSL